MLAPFAVLCLASFVSADVYLHNPRGSNNRLDEPNRDRRNKNALFDSQNNARGGYNVGSVFYYQGSSVRIEWTNQHSCNTENNHCDMVIQYMCSDLLRDGVTFKTIPVDLDDCANSDCDTDRRFRMHESSDNYLRCFLRERNRGLFTAQQNLNRRRSRARHTRQNAGGTRRGYECPEERDYYPYWHSSPWKDIVVMTNDVSRCPYYTQESQNVKSRWECVFPREIMEKLVGTEVVLPNTEEKCNAFELPERIESPVRKPTWTEFPAHGIPAPDCEESQYSRDNHNGNGLGGYLNSYTWTVPSDVEHENCALRIRYNISTTDYDRWTTDHTFNPRRLRDGSKVEMAGKYGFSSEVNAKGRGYVFKNDPIIKVFDEVNMDLRLAINTAQFGRTFQDRSHSFAIRSRPAELEGKTIHNLNVRGKRGNSQQVYPAMEYDFVPNNLEMTAGDYIHIQWTGSNTNPRNNAGQGLAGTDRNNIALLGHQVYPEGTGAYDYGGGKFGHYGVNYPMNAENATFLGFSLEDTYTLAYVDPGQFRGEMSLLDDAGTYFNLEPTLVTQLGTYHYMCTRNNAFTNRDQKGRIVVRPAA